jgi:hypothetical protein
MEAETSESDLLGVEQDTTNPLHLLQQTIAAMPGVDTDRVQAAINKLCAGGLQIMGNEAERLACAERIAKQIIDETSHNE